MTASQRFFSLGLLVFLAAGCGQKGPLYLEGHEPPSQRAAAKKAAPAAPAAPESAQPESAPAEQEQEQQKEQR